MKYLRFEPRFANLFQKLFQQLDRTTPAAMNGNTSLVRRPVGRPARIDSQAIFDAALELGLDQLTMKAVADQLGVGISTLYQYVKNRSELVRQAALHQAQTRTPPKNSGQHWAELAVQYAQDLLNTLLEEPQLIIELMGGRLGPRVEADVLEHFLTAMHAHGFSPEDGVRLYRSISMVTVGGAVGILHIHGHYRGTSHAAELRGVLAEREPDQLPLVRQAVDEYRREDVQVWLMALHELLAGVAAARGERLPATLNAARRVSVVAVPEFPESKPAAEAASTAAASYQPTPL